MKTTPEAFQKLLKRYRKQQNLTRKQAVFRLFVPVSTIASWEKGHTSPKPSVYQRLTMQMLREIKERPNHLL